MAKSWQQTISQLLIEAAEEGIITKEDANYIWAELSKPPKAEPYEILTSPEGQRALNEALNEYVKAQYGTKRSTEN